jgi:hypothetical protein
MQLGRSGGASRNLNSFLEHIGLIGGLALAAIQAEAARRR